MIFDKIFDTITHLYTYFIGGLIRDEDEDENENDDYEGTYMLREFNERIQGIAKTAQCEAFEVLKFKIAEKVNDLFAWLDVLSSKEELDKVETIHITELLIKDLILLVGIVDVYCDEHADEEAG